MLVEGVADSLRALGGADDGDDLLFGEGAGFGGAAGEAVDRVAVVEEVLADEAAEVAGGAEDEVGGHGVSLGAVGGDGWSVLFKVDDPVVSEL